MKGRHSDAEMFFEKIILEYVCGDLKWLIERRAPTLGPLAACIGAGIDTAGGCICEFRRDNSASRSACFMEKHMGLEGEAARLVYSCVRCGYIHEGIGKLNVSWFADYRRLIPNCCVYRRGDGGVAVNLVELAFVYLHAVEKLWREQRNRILYLPRVQKKGSSD